MSEERRIAEEEKLWLPPRAELEVPVDAIPGDEAPEDRNVEFNGTSELAQAKPEELILEVQRHGISREPEIGAYLEDHPLEVSDEGELIAAGYSDTYWTHFDWRADVGRAIARVQKKFPYLTFANTYYCHPPVYGRRYEFVSVDYWGGGMVNGRYVGYRGKPIGNALGWKVFNAAFGDKYPPNIGWIIFGGRMWSRGYGWGPSPAGPPDSDPGHFNHVHISYAL